MGIQILGRSMLKKKIPYYCDKCDNVIMDYGTIPGIHTVPRCPECGSKLTKLPGSDTRHEPPKDK